MPPGGISLPILESSSFVASNLCSTRYRWTSSQVPMKVSLKLVALALLGTATSPAWAYLDPGHVSLWWQALVAAMAAAGAAGGTVWTRVRSWWGGGRASEAAGRSARGIRTPWPRSRAATGRVRGSFRDPSATVFEANGRIFRGVTIGSAAPVRALLRSAFYQRHARAGLVESVEVSASEVLESGLAPEDVARYPLWLEHECIDVVSYPYEWSFAQLKEAALLHLALHIDALEHGFDLKDASAYNVQFIDGQPVFIDTLSFIPYREGAHWTGYKQFCEQFLNPLVLRAVGGVDFNAWYRGALEGIETTALARVLPWHARLRPALLVNIHLHARAIARANARAGHVTARQRTRPLPRKNYLAHLRSLQRCVEGLHNPGETYWQDYAGHTSYSAAGSGDKDERVAAFVRERRVQVLLDIGCNAGHFSEVALRAGARKVVGIDVDPGAIDLAARRAVSQGLSFMPLLIDVTNPSPAMGWESAERLPFEARMIDADASLCLALIHHVVIGRNVPLDQFVQWLVGRAPMGLVEFVPKDDPMVVGLLAHREDVFHDYSEAAFMQSLQRHARILNVQGLQDSKRKLFTFVRLD